MCGLIAIALIALGLCQNGLAQLLDESCDGPVPVNFRITQGQRALPRTTNWMAGIYNGTTFYCGGTLVHKGYVLTAAHCVKEMKLDELVVHLGEYDRSCPESKCPHVERHNASEIIVHPSYNKLSLSIDLALIKLQFEVVLKSYIRPICIILDEEITSENVHEFSAFGWGKTDHELDSKILHFLDVHRIADELCFTSGVNKICAAGDKGGDTCTGDSGGPLAANFTYRGKDRYVQFGVVSYGDSDCHGFGVYTDVNAFKYWIANTVLESETRLLTEHCRSDWGSGILVRLWEMSLFEHNFIGALITRKFVVTVASAFPDNIHDIKVETRYLESYEVAWYRKHPQFTYSAESIKNNIAVIKLSKGVPDSFLVQPICMGVNTASPKTWTALLYSYNDQVMGSTSVALNRIDNAACSRKIGIPVEANQLCVDKPDESIYAPYEMPGSVIASVDTVNDVQKYLLVGLISHVKDGAIVITKIQDHEKWIADRLKY
ncbi:uncharacterized protein LOC108053964 [Drosophila rhopaloa]|uniref:Peptidase S1 domain-containing protein n=1 Tax=Drosophila rhopaloa TaxID=1041015 RepID=A0ABM5I8S5_DRORH|nr:uncharacterized protein LOC108053964 [Drosophila rhopaloa]